MVPVLRQFVLIGTALLARSTHRLLFRRLVSMAVLDDFWPIAVDLHRVCSASSSHELDADLRNLCAQYFSSDIDELLLPIQLKAVLAEHAA